MQAFQERLLSLYKDAAALDPDGHEGHDIAILRSNAKRLVERGVSLCREVADTHGGLGDIEAVAYVASLGLQRQLRALAGDSANRDVADMIAETGASVRETCRMARAVDAALSKHSGQPRRCPDFGSDLEIALKVRAAYRKLYYQIEPDWDVTPVTLEARMETAARAVLAVLQHPDTGHMRARDRAALRHCASKMIAWQQTRAATDGIRVWRDLANTVEVLQQINARSELCAHDVSVATDAMDRLERGEPIRLVVRALFGRSIALDALIARDNVSAAEWRAVLTEIKSSLMVQATH